MHVNSYFDQMLVMFASMCERSLSTLDNLLVGIDLSRNDVTIFSNFFPISFVQNEKIDKYRKYQINSTLGEVVTDS